MKIKIKKVFLYIIAPIFFIIVGSWLAVWGAEEYSFSKKLKKFDGAVLVSEKVQNKTIENLLDSRRAETEKKGEKDLFGKDGIVKILLIGLDKRAGQKSGHCDAIQLIVIDKKKSQITITAVPRGTYSPLPAGIGATSSDYYVSNACGLVGLDYGVKQIEKILGQKEDHLIIVGFSDVLGILRNLKLPTTDTLRWLRHRQGYAIGEPQRARNHSTFLKHLLTQYLPKKNSPLDKIWQYVMYKMVKTDLSFADSRNLIENLSAMNLSEHPEKIVLNMRPAYSVQDIPYSPDNLSQYLDKMLTPIKDRLNKKDYSGEDEATVEAEIIKLIEEKKNDREFIVWAFDNNLWLQIDDKEKRLAMQYDFMKSFSLLATTSFERENIIADYILEMDNIGEPIWAQKGQDLLILNKKSK